MSGATNPRRKEAEDIVSTWTLPAAVLHLPVPTCTVDLERLVDLIWTTDQTVVRIPRNIATTVFQSVEDTRRFVLSLLTYCKETVSRKREKFVYLVAMRIN